MPKTTPAAPRSSRGTLWVSLLRTLLCGILMTILAAGCLYLYYTSFDFYHDRLVENGSKTLAWLTEQLSFSLPFILICLFQTAVYHGRDPRDGTARREMFWQIALVAVLVYAVMLPYLSSISEALYTNALASGVKLPKTEGKVEITLLMELHDWFIRLTIPLLLLMVYHSARGRRERMYPEAEEAEPLLTVAEYEAQKAARVAADMNVDMDVREATDMAAEAAREETVSGAEPAQADGTTTIDYVKEENAHEC